MHQPQNSIGWTITCQSQEKAQALQQWLSPRIDINRVLTHTTRVSPNGMEEDQTVPHRLGDYFADIRVLGNSKGNPASFRLVFLRGPKAGRFWKDLMVNIIQEIATSPQKPSIVKSPADANN